jgi:anti-anti-sigma factor
MALAQKNKAVPVQGAVRFGPQDLDGLRLVNLGVETTAIGDSRALLVAVSGELDLSTCDQLKPAADESVFGRRPLILDLSRCAFIDSSGLRLVLQIATELTDGGGPEVPMAIVAGESAMRRCSR